MNELFDVLKETYPDIDFTKEKNLIDDGILDSVGMVTLISAIEDHFDISVTMEYIQPSYFQSAENMWEMIEELQ
jgi:acyl carrier protein